MISPSAVTTVMAETAVARFPFRSPEPWVAVAQAPATEMCGRDARLWSANPAACSGPASSPYRTAPSIVTAPATGSRSKTRFIRASESRWPSVSAMSLNEWREPSTRSGAVFLTMS